MQEVSSTLLQAVITVAVPIVSAFAIRFLNDLALQAKAAAKNEIAKRYIAIIADTIKTAVIAVSQDYVDALKKSGEFSKDCQKEAFNRAVSLAKSMLTADASRFLAETYGDIEAFIQAKIEAQVLLEK